MSTPPGFSGMSDHRMSSQMQNRNPGVDNISNQIMNSQEQNGMFMSQMNNLRQQMDRRSQLNNMYHLFNASQKSQGMEGVPFFNQDGYNYSPNQSNQKMEAASQQQQLSGFWPQLGMNPSAFGNEGLSDQSNMNSNMQNARFAAAVAAQQHGMNQGWDPSLLYGMYPQARNPMHNLGNDAASVRAFSAACAQAQAYAQVEMAAAESFRSSMLDSQRNVQFPVPVRQGAGQMGYNRRLPSPIPNGSTKNMFADGRGSPFGLNPAAYMSLAAVASGNYQQNQPSLFKRRGRIRVACVECHKAKSACDSSRPCRRCIRLHKADACKDRPHRKKGRPRKRQYHMRDNEREGFWKHGGEDNGEACSKTSPSHSAAKGLDLMSKCELNEKGECEKASASISPQTPQLHAKANNSLIHGARVTVGTDSNDSDFRTISRCTDGDDSSYCSDSGNSMFSRRDPDNSTSTTTSAASSNSFVRSSSINTIHRGSTVPSSSSSRATTTTSSPINSRSSSSSSSSSSVDNTERSSNRNRSCDSNSVNSNNSVNSHDSVNSSNDSKAHCIAMSDSDGKSADSIESESSSSSSSSSSSNKRRKIGNGLRNRRSSSNNLSSSSSTSSSIKSNGSNNNVDGGSSGGSDNVGSDSGNSDGDQGTNTGSNDGTSDSSPSM